MPYAPQTAYRGDEYIFQGGRQTAEALSGWLQNFLNQEKQVNQMGRSADYFVKANQSADGSNPVLNEMGIHPDEWANLGARDKSAAVQGLLQSRASRQQAEAVAAQAQLRQAEAAKAQTDADAAQGFPQFAQFLNEEMSGTPSSPPPIKSSDWQNILNGGGPMAIVQTPGSATTTNGSPAQGVAMGPAVLRALARVQAMNPRVSAAIASKILPQMIANNSGDDTEPVATTVNTPSGPLAVISKRGSKEFLLDPRAAIDARTQGQKDILDAKSTTAAKEIAPSDRLKAISTQIAAIRRVPAAMRSQEDADDLAQLMQAQQSLMGTGGNNNTPEPRVRVKGKDGMQYTVPKSQLADAVKQGYAEVK